MLYPLSYWSIFNLPHGYYNMGSASKKRAGRVLGRNLALGQRNSLPAANFVLR